MKEKILNVNHLTVKLKKGKRPILDDVSFDLYEGDVLAFDGLNGSGKSTLLKVIYGQIAEYDIESGSIVFYPLSDKNVLDFSEKEVLSYHSKVAYVPQKDLYDGLNKVTVGDLIDQAIAETKIDKTAVCELFSKYFGENSKIKLNSIPAKMSGGEQRLISIFLGLVCLKDARLMIIDEPLNNLDFENVMKVSDLINQIRLDNPYAGMLMVTHCKIITCINRQRRMINGKIEDTDSVYECHHCMGEPDCNMFYNMK